MSNLDQESKDQRLNPAGTKSGMEEDSSAMTVEFLRARLLSERSVSQSARQRADELSKKVAELEEQLRIVHVQRTKAEKATADVLAILESNGITEVSEAYYSSSDHETQSEYNAGDKSLREEESSVDSKVRKNDSEEVSGSDVDFTSAHGKSLSWKGHRETPRLLGKFKDSTLRRKSNFASVGTSPKHRQGKSCRQTRRKDSSRSVPEELKASPFKASSLEKEVATGSTTGEDRGLSGNSVEYEQNASFNGNGSNELGKVVDMDKALEHQSQLIGQYEEMEKAQREWEEKFREHNNDTPDSCDPGNRSDVTEERFEVKAQSPVSADSVFTEFHSAKNRAQDMAKFELPSSHAVVQPLQGQSSGNQLIHATFTQTSSLQETNGNQHQGTPASTYRPTSNVSTPYQSPLHDSPIIHSARSSSSNTADGIGHSKPSVSRKELYALVPHQGPNQLESVLDALKQAKQSLEQKIKGLPLVEDRGFTGKSIHSSLPITVPENKVDMPTGCAGLFRLPTDLSVNEKKRILAGSNTQLGIGSGYYPDRGLPATATSHFTGQQLETRPSFLPDQRLLLSPVMEEGIKPSFLPDQRFLTSPVMETGIKPTFLPDQRFLTSPVMEARIKPTFLPDQRFLTSPVMEAGIKPTFLPNQRFLTSPVMEEGPRITNPRPSFNPCSDTGVPSSSRYSNNYPTYPVSPSYLDLTPTMPSTRGGVPTFARSRTVGPMAADNLSLLNDSIRPNMYR